MRIEARNKFSTTIFPIRRRLIQSSLHWERSVRASHAIAPRPSDHGTLSKSKRHRCSRYSIHSVRATPLSATQKLMRQSPLPLDEPWLTNHPRRWRAKCCRRVSPNILDTATEEYQDVNMKVFGPHMEGSTSWQTRAAPGVGTSRYPLDYHPKLPSEVLG